MITGLSIILTAIKISLYIPASGIMKISTYMEEQIHYSYHILCKLFKTKNVSLRSHFAASIFSLLFSIINVVRLCEECKKERSEYEGRTRQRENSCTYRRSNTG